MKYNLQTLKKLENIFTESQFQVRYGKGSFTRGYCMLDAKNIVVINKLYDTDARISCLLELLDVVSIEEEKLEPETIKFYQSAIKFKNEELNKVAEPKNEVIVAPQLTDGAEVS